jgi:cellobiose epimerase
MTSLSIKMNSALKEIKYHLEKGIIPFWTENAVDNLWGGFLTNFDGNGKPTEDTDKYIVTQTRMIWGMSVFAEKYPGNMKLLIAADQGVDFFLKHFWDKKNGGWFWKVQRDGTVIDDGKVVYGQSFALYALAQYTLSTGNPIGLEYAEKTFDLLQKYCTDTFQGGYYENLEPDWSLSEAGFAAGDRKSLDIHMHLLEAYTTLAKCSQKEIHLRKLNEIINLILEKMVNKEIGCGLNQFDLSFRSIPAINIRRTWNAERTVGEVVEKSTDTTSYGHNVELAWLLNRALEVLGKSLRPYEEVTRKLVDHSLKYGFDYKLGGVYRDGLHDGPVLVKDKEWWQNCEVLIGYLDAFEKFGEEKYFNAFFMTWDFDKKHFIDSNIGEWHQLLNQCGSIINGDIGNPWKAIYHTGRAMLECCERLEGLMHKM